MTTSKWLTQLTRDFGKLAAEIPNPSDKVVKLPSPSLNWSVGNGGITQGKAVCLFGPESGGKSLLMQLILIQLQQDNPEGICILFDAEYSFNPAWFSKLGGDVNRLIVRQTNNPEMIFDYIERDLLQLLQDGCPIVGLAIDSVKSIRYPKDIKKVSTALTMGGGGASYLGPAFKAILPVIREYNITTILVQQVYEELDPMKAMRNPFKVPDGRALKHFADYMLQVEKIDTKNGTLTGGETIIGSDAQIGHKVRIKTKKNRVGVPARVAEFSLNYEKGIVDTENEAINLAKSLGVIYHPKTEKGTVNNMMWKYSDYDAIRGEPAMRQWIVENPHILEQVIKDCDGVSDDKVNERNSSFEVSNIDIGDE
jgi:recombination protein RecA